MSEFVNNNSESEIGQLQDWLFLFLSKWYWFLASIVAALLIALFYLATTTPVYTRSMSVLIKDNSKSSSSISTEDMFENMGMFNSKTNVNNELLTLKAPILMESVVKKLGLNVTYTASHHLQRHVLYKSSPIDVRMEKGAALDRVSMTIRILPNHKLSIADMMHDGEEVDFEPTKCDLADTIATPLGRMVVLPTEFYNEEYENTSIHFNKTTLRAAAKGYSKALKAELADKKANVIDLTINDVSTERAEDILSTLVSAYNESWINNKNQITISTSEFIGDRLDIIEKELSGVDENISAFKSKNLLPDVAAVSNKYMMQSTENERNLLGLTTQLAMTRYIGNYLRADKEMQKLLPTNSGIDNMNMETQISEYNTLMLQRNNLLANSSEQNPVVKSLNKSLASMKEAIIGSVDDLIAILKIQVSNISNSEAKNRDNLASSPNQVKYLLSVERQQKVKEALYVFLLQKREENELSQTFTAYNTQIINPPMGSPLPVAPRKGLVLLMAFFLGAALPMGILFLIESLNTLVRSRKDLEGLTVPFVGEIPAVGEKKKRFAYPKKVIPPVGIIIEGHSRNMVNEAFRIARTNIDFMRGKVQRGTVIMTTSMNPGSGKTFTTSNLSVAMAIKGSKTIVLDADLRKASLSILVKSPKRGLSNYLNGEVEDIHTVAIKGEFNENLTIIPVGTIPPNPSELLLSARFEALLQQLRGEYDYIFLDCPPVEIVTDSAIIAKQSDMTLFVVRAGLLDRRMLPVIESLYASKQYNNMCMILNGTDHNSGKYGYQKYGYGKYGYGYGKEGGYGNVYGKNS
ncbi:MAG: polysaccharide biosynthesis tyrosine autokinase [Alistipes sp.]